MTSTPQAPPPVFAQALRYVGIVAMVGIVLATVFTAWTPSALAPGELMGQLAEALAVKRVIAPQTAIPPLPTEARPLPRVGIVAGHKGAGNDPGAVCPDGLTEAAVNLDIATRVKAGLEANGFHIDLLDEFDSRLEGYEALAVVSIHNDSCAYINEAATGFKVAGALDSGAPDRTTRLVNCLADRYAARTTLTFHRGSVTADMTNYHSFYEVSAQTPIAIIETGFLNLDRRILTAEPQRVAQGIIDGILCYVLNQPVKQLR